MRNPPFDQFYESMRYPERAFNMSLRANDFEPLESNGSGAVKETFEVPSALCEPLVYFLFEINRTGYAEMHIRTEVTKKGQKSRVHWESGTSEVKYLYEQDLKRLHDFVERYYRSQGEKHGLLL